jgi:hypothetical protein
MKNILLAVVFVFIANVAFATTTTTPVAGDIAAKIVAPLTVTHASGAKLNFGTLVSPTSAATVVISNANPGVATDTGVQRIAADAVSSDHFTVVNPEGVQYSVAIQESTVSIGTGTPMTVSAFNPSCSSGCTGTDIYVGGQLDINANQPAGTYTGQYHLTITY